MSMKTYRVGVNNEYKTINSLLPFINEPATIILEDELYFAFNKDYDSDEVEYVKGNIIDLTPYVWEIIFANIPRRVVAENSKIQTSGDGWEVISEDEYYEYK